MDLIGALVHDGALRAPERTAIKTHDGLVRTYAELNQRSTRLANALLDLGLDPGDRVAAWLDTSPGYVELYFAAAKAGLVMVPVNSFFTKHEAEFLLADSGARVLFHLPSFAADAAELLGRTEVETVIEVGHWSDPQNPFESLLASGSEELPQAPQEDDLYVIAYTSGTTGRPKGAMVTHRSLMATVRQHAHSYRTPQGSVIIYHSNMSFVATVLGLVISHVYVTGTVYMTGKVTPESLLDAIEAEKGTFTFIPAPWIAAMTELCRRFPEKWGTMKTFVHTASKADPDELKAFAETVGWRFLEGYGMTETSGGLIAVTDIDDVVRGSTANDLWASAGRAVVDSVIRIIGEDGKELPHDGVSIGEIVVKAPNLAIGYWNRLDATESAFRDGWYHSGDLGSMDAGGYVYVADRRSDLIVSGGMNIYPSEIEHALAKLDGIAEVAVVGVRHERWGSTPVAYVVRGAGSDLREDDILEHCDQFLARYKRPSRIEFIDQLPRNASNKVLRRVLRESASSASSS